MSDNILKLCYLQHIANTAVFIFLAFHRLALKTVCHTAVTKENAEHFETVALS